MKLKLFIATITVTVLSSLFVITSPVLAEEDDHYISSDYYFITKEKFTQGYIYVTLATMKTPATKQTKDQAEFTEISSGNEVWTKFYYKTRILAKNEIKTGVVIIACNVSDEEAYRAPDSKDEAINTSWFMAKITDVSDMYKGYVTVSGGYKVRLNNMRIAVK